MKLYFTPGTCSLAVHIVLRELGLACELVKVQLGTEPVIAATGADFRAVNPEGYVPVLELDDGQRLTEGAAILQYLAELAPESGLLPAATPLQRYEAVRWLVYISSELHKMFSPWLFHPEYGEQAAAVARARLARRLLRVEAQLDGREFLLGEHFSVADAYLFAIVSWARPAKLPLDAFPRLQAWLARIGERDSVRAARQAERGG